MYLIDNTSGSHLFAMPYFIGACLMPLVGFVIDRYGKRTFILILSVILLLLTLFYMHE